MAASERGCEATPSPVSADSDEPFETSNYGIKTWSRAEWWFVVDPEGGKAELAKLHREGKLPSATYPAESQLSMRKRRQAVELESFDGGMREINGQLRKLAIKPMCREELVGARLYTGPMFQKYNGVMRGATRVGAEATRDGPQGPPEWALQEWTKLCKGNRYTTTIWVINSVIVKLGKLTVVERVYRGISGRVLSAAMSRRDQRSKGRGGVEMAFLSTTRDREVAMAYAKGGSKDAPACGIVLEIQQGLIDRGADLAWLSQYPFEREICFTPLTALEVVSTRIEDDMQVVEMRPTVNQSAQMIDATVQDAPMIPSLSLQHSQLAFLNLLKEDFEGRCSQDSKGALEKALRPLRVLQESHQMRKPAWFNDTRNIQSATDQALAAKEEVVRLLQMPETWSEVSKGERAIAEDMVQLAKLCANEGDAPSAVQLLHLSIKSAPPSQGLHPWLSKNDVRAVDELYRALNDGVEEPSRQVDVHEQPHRPPASAGEAAEECLSRYDRLLLLHLLIEQLKAQPPWCAAIVTLAAMPAADGGDADGVMIKGFCRLLQKFLRAELLPLGHRVFGSNSGDETWPVEGVLLRKRDTLEAEAGPPAFGILSAKGPWKKTMLSSKQIYTLRVHGEEVDVTFVLPCGEGGCGGLLRAAADLGLVQIVEQLLEAGVSAHEADGRARTALHYAAAHTSEQHALVCERILAAPQDSGQSLNIGFAPDLDGMRPYDLALVRRSSRVRCTIKPSEMDNELREFERECAKRLGASGSSKWRLSISKADGSTSQMRRHWLDNAMLQRLKAEDAARKGAERAEVDKPIACGVTWLMVASARGHIRTVGWLLQLESSESRPPPRRPSLMGKMFGQPPSDSAQLATQLAPSDGRSSCPLVDVFRQSVGGCTALTMAAEAGHVDVVAALFDGLPDQEAATLVNLAERHNVTALMRASQNGFEDVAKTLLDRGAIVNAQREDTKRTALMLAARCGSVELTRLLLEKKADATLADKDALTALSSAAKFNHVHVLRELLGVRMPPAARAPRTAPAAAPAASEAADGTSTSAAAAAEQQHALLLAARFGHGEAVRLLLQHDTDVNGRDASGKTPLYWVCQNGHPTLVPQLLEAGADVNAQDAEGRHALMACCRQGHTDVAHMLVVAKAELLHQDSSTRQTALMLASCAGHAVLVASLLHEAASMSFDRTKEKKKAKALAEAGEAGAPPASSAPTTPRRGSLPTGLPPAPPTEPPPAAEEETEEDDDVFEMTVPEGVVPGDMVQATTPSGVKVRLMVPEGAEVGTTLMLEQRARMLEARDAEGRSALMHASLAGQVAVVRVLLLAGADRYAVDLQDMTPLMAAYEREHASTNHASTDHASTVVEFRSAASPLQRHRPPLCALANTLEVGQAAILGVGSLVVDIGTGEMKLLAHVHFGRAETHELAKVRACTLVPWPRWWDGVCNWWHPTTDTLPHPLIRLHPQVDFDNRFDKDIFGDQLFRKATEELRAGLESLRAKPWRARVTWTRALVGVTAWYSALELAARGPCDAFLDALVESLSDMLAQLAERTDEPSAGSSGGTAPAIKSLASLAALKFQWRALSGEEEAQCECRAVEYAMREQGRPQPIAVLAGGSGSVQLTGLDAFISVSIPLQEGTSAMMSAMKEEASTADAPGTAGALRRGIEQWQSRVATAFQQLKHAGEAASREASNRRGSDRRSPSGSSPSGSHLSGSSPGTNNTRLPAMLSRGAQRAHEETDAKPLTVVLISAFYHVGVAAGLVPKNADGSLPLAEPQSALDHAAPDVCAALEKLMYDANAKPRDVANAARLHAVLHELFEVAHLPKVRCLFARDWMLDGGSGSAGDATSSLTTDAAGTATRPPCEFRTTWSSGWWLDRLIEQLRYETLPKAFADGLPRAVSSRAAARLPLLTGYRRRSWEDLSSSAQSSVGGRKSSSR